MRIYQSLITTSIVLVFCINCQDSENKDIPKKKVVDSLSFEQIEKDIKKEQLAEMYKIEKKAVIFFMIDREEAKKLAHELGDSYRWETDAMFNNFINQSRDFKKILGKHSIHSDLVHNKKFKIIFGDSSSVVFDREKEEQIMGEIISDGKKQPFISFGMYRNKELAKIITDFFDIEQLGYVPPDTLFLPNEENSDSILVEDPEIDIKDSI